MLKQYVTEAKAKLKDEAYEAALAASAKALELDGLNFQALLCMGKSHFHLHEPTKAVDAYKRAAAIQADVPFAWKGMLEVYESTADHAKMLEPLEKLSAIVYANGKFDRCQKMLLDMAIAATLAKDYAKALASWHPLLVKEKARPELFAEENPNDELPPSVDMWLSVLDLVQAIPKTAGPFQAPEAVLYALVGKIRAVATTTSGWVCSDKVAVVLDAYADLALTRLVQPQSTTKNLDRQTLDAICRDMITWCPVAKRAAEILLLRAEDSDGALDATQKSTCESILRHVDPDNLLLMAIDGLAMHAAKAYVPARETLTKCIAAGPHLLAARVALAEIAMVPGPTFQPQVCLDMIASAQDAVTWRYDNLLTAPSLAILDETHLSLLSGAAYRALHKYADAIVCYEGILEHAPLLEAPAIGLAEAYLAQRDVVLAANALQFLSEEPTSVALAAARGYLLYLQGDLDAARRLLEAGSALTGEALDLACLKRRLADVYWDLDGEYRRDKAFCVSALLSAAKLNSFDAESFAGLGRWYLDIALDLVRAEKCFLKALSLNPHCERAGTLLSGLYEAHDQEDRNVRLWTDMTMTADGVMAPIWALRRLAQHQLNAHDEAAIASMHKVLRQAPSDASYWAALGHVYASFGRVMAAQKSYAKAVSLGMDTNPSVLAELARIELSVGLFDEALAHLRTAAAHVVANDIAVRKLLAETLFQHAKFLCGQGLYGRAAAHLCEASGLLQTCLETASNEPALHKLLGDVHCFAFYLAPGDFASWVDFLSAGTAAYKTVSVMEPNEPAAWLDLGLGHWYEAMARGAVDGVPMGKLALQHAPVYPSSIDQLMHDASTAFAQALALEPLNAHAWNAFGAVQRQIVLKHFGFVRAIQLANLDCAWANLGMLILQGVNPNNPAMWTGYGLLEIEKGDASQAHAAYTCALQMRLDLDVLYGVASTGLQVSTTSKEALPLPQIQFALQKYLERDPFEAAAQNAHGVVLSQLGLHAAAATAFDSVATTSAILQGNIVRNYIAAKQWPEALAAWTVLETEDDTTKQLLAAQVSCANDIYTGLNRFGDAHAALQRIRSPASALHVALATYEAEFKASRSLSPASMAALQALMKVHPRHASIAATLARVELDWATYWTTSNGDDKDSRDKESVPSDLCDAGLVPAWLDAVQRQDGSAVSIAALAHLVAASSAVTRPAATALPVSRHVHAILDVFTVWTPPRATVQAWYRENPRDPNAWRALVLTLFKRYTATHDASILKTLGLYLKMKKEAHLTWEWHVLMSGYCAWTHDATGAKTHAASASTLAASMPNASLYAARSVVFVDPAAALALYRTSLRGSADDVVLAEVAALVTALGWPKAAIRIWKGLHQLDDKWKFMAIVQRYVLSLGVESPKVLAKYLKEIQNFVKDDAETSARAELVAQLVALTP
ncbi:hypothetical protein SPRG_14077 [Saprolegnia parasitica CBS 223.65]|uniref:Uncharacterized protein n=1 Tax=Saprolegnia parasitica (strain CBS 223.65) TaxID=695850 RepID=A0A067C2S0_SAPPC|nr:hypothetical protein SPRG_14077 [Saprolegnia parasitica CBS 223.65]KDO20846.1 hypothetical protein SPRG_14077 [Saprolegnia parasitica CBS 223.65]|eukprot:XP_012208424.1 hypothetical protein SPRG_14077 [Saprolegnia parasitica CBS 223.65]